MSVVPAVVVIVLPFNCFMPQTTPPESRAGLDQADPGSCQTRGASSERRWGHVVSA